MKTYENKAQFIGSRIKLAREEAGYPQLDLAKLLDFESSTAISLIENGERRVTAENLEKIANFLHKDIRFFLGEDGDVPAMDVKVALRADPRFDTSDKEEILKFIDFVNSKKDGK